MNWWPAVTGLWRKRPRCPECGGKPVWQPTGRHALCGTQGCPVTLWDPRYPDTAAPPAEKEKQPAMTSDHDDREHSHIDLTLNIGLAMAWLRPAQRLIKKATAYGLTVSHIHDGGIAVRSHMLTVSGDPDALDEWAEDVRVLARWGRLDDGEYEDD